MSFPAGSNIRLMRPKSNCFYESKNRRVDLSDTIMPFSAIGSRTVYLGLRILGKSKTQWAEPLLQDIEHEIRYDLTFDAYRVQITRITQALGEGTDTEFVWRLRVRP